MWFIRPLHKSLYLLYLPLQRKLSKQDVKSNTSTNVLLRVCSTLHCGFSTSKLQNCHKNRLQARGMIKFLSHTWKVLHPYLNGKTQWILLKFDCGAQAPELQIAKLTIIMHRMWHCRPIRIIALFSQMDHATQRVPRAKLGNIENLNMIQNEAAPSCNQLFSFGLACLLLSLWRWHHILVHIKVGK